MKEAGPPLPPKEEVDQIHYDVAKKRKKREAAPTGGDLFQMQRHAQIDEFDGVMSANIGTVVSESWMIRETESVCVKCEEECERAVTEVRVSPHRSFHTTSLNRQPTAQNNERWNQVIFPIVLPSAYFRYS